MRDIKYRDDGRPEDLLQELGYETQDIAYKKFTIYGAYFFGFFVFCIISGFFIMLWMSPTGLQGGRMADSKPKIEAATGTPLLQSNITARTDIRDLRRDETAQLDSAGETKVAGVYHIPIDKAIEEVAKLNDADRAKIGLPPSSTNTARQQALADIMSSDSGDTGEAPATDPSHGASPSDSAGGHGG